MKKALLEKAADLFLSQNGYGPDGQEVGTASSEQDRFEANLEQLRGRGQATLHEVRLAAEQAKS